MHGGKSQAEATDYINSAPAQELIGWRNKIQNEIDDKGGIDKMTQQEVGLLLQQELISFADHIYKENCASGPIGIGVCDDFMAVKGLSPDDLQDPDVLAGIIAELSQELQSTTDKQKISDLMELAIQCNQKWQAERRNPDSPNYVSNQEASNKLKEEQEALKNKTTLSADEQDRLNTLTNVLQQDENEHRIFYVNDETERFVKSDTFKQIETYVESKNDPSYVAGSLGTVFKMQAGMEPKINLEYFDPNEMDDLMKSSGLQGKDLVEYMLKESEKKAQSLGKDFDQNQAFLEMGNYLMNKGNQQDLKYGLFTHKDVVEEKSYDDNLLERFVVNGVRQWELEEVYNSKPKDQATLGRMLTVGSITDAEYHKKIAELPQALQDYEQRYQEAKKNAELEINQLVTDILGYSPVVIEVNETKGGVMGGMTYSLPEGPYTSITLYDPFTGDKIAQPSGERKVHKIMVTAINGLNVINHEVYGHVNQTSDGNRLWSENINAAGQFCSNNSAGLCYDQTMTNINLYHYLSKNVTSSFGNKVNQGHYANQPVEKPAWAIGGEK